MATLSEMVERIGVVRERRTLHSDSYGFAWWDDRGEGFACNKSDASNAVLAELLRRLPDGWKVHRYSRDHFGIVSDTDVDDVSEGPDPLTALYAAFERFPEFFAQPAKGGDGGEG